LGRNSHLTFYSLLCFIFISNIHLLQRFSTCNTELPNNTKGYETMVDMASLKKPAAYVRLLISTGTEENNSVLKGLFCELIDSPLRIYVSFNQ
jgi:hypothetical protein